MTAALRSIDCTDSAPDRTVTLERQLAALQLDLASLRVRNSTLVRELRRAVEAPKIVGQSVVDGVLTLTYSNGKIMQHRPTCDESTTETVFAYRWVEMQAPETPAAIVAAVLDDAIVYDGMACTAGAD